MLYAANIIIMTQASGWRVIISNPLRPRFSLFGARDNQKTAAFSCHQPQMPLHNPVYLVLLSPPTNNSSSDLENASQSILGLRMLLKCPATERLASWESSCLHLSTHVLRRWFSQPIHNPLPHALSQQLWQCGGGSILYRWGFHRSCSHQRQTEWPFLAWIS